MNKHAQNYIAGHRGLVGFAIMRKLAHHLYENVICSILYFNGK